MNEPLHELFSRTEVLVTLGAGGVGKTTCSVAAAILGAQAGKRVGLLSIDPAKRLAQAMGLSLSAALTTVPLGDIIPRGSSGSLRAAMLDQKVVFDEMVRRFASSHMVEKIFANRLYQVVSTNLGGPLEYMALAKLEQMVSSGEFDLIVLDTPPDTHAIDFLLRPNILSGFMENRVMTWLIKPFYIARRLGVQRLLAAGEKLMGGIAAVTGIKALNTLAELLVLLEDVIAGLHRSGQKLDKILRQESTSFMLVTVPNTSAIRSARHLLNQLRQQGFPLDLIVINQVLPAHLRSLLRGHGATLVPPRNEAWQHASERLLSRELGAEALVDALIKQVMVPWTRSPTVIRVEERDQQLHSLEDIAAMAASWEIEPSNHSKLNSLDD